MDAMMVWDCHEKRCHKVGQGGLGCGGDAVSNTNHYQIQAVLVPHSKVGVGEDPSLWPHLRREWNGSPPNSCPRSVASKSGEKVEHTAHPPPTWQTTGDNFGGFLFQDPFIAFRIG